MSQNKRINWRGDTSNCLVCGKCDNKYIIDIDSLGKIFLLNLKVSDKTNLTEISRLFDNSLSILGLERVRCEFVLLFVSDALMYGKSW